MKGKSDNIKRVRKYFSLAEYEKEEKYLTEMAAKGWRFVDTNGTLYTFERCEPEQVAYRLDFSGLPLDQRDDYYAMFRDYGWEYLQDYNGFSYFRKPAEGVSPEDLEIFSDGESHLEMAKKIMTAKLIPLIGLMLCVVPLNVSNIRRIFRNGQPDRGDWIYTIVVSVLLLTGIAVLIKICADFVRLKKKYKRTA